VKPGTASRLAWSVWALVLILLAATIVLRVLNGAFASGEDVLLLIVSILAGVGYGTVGAMIASRQRRNPIGWLFLFMPWG
jgi:hypothetical protein